MPVVLAIDLGLVTGLVTLVSVSSGLTGTARAQATLHPNATAKLDVTLCRATTLRRAPPTIRAAMRSAATTRRSSAISVVSTVTDLLRFADLHLQDPSLAALREVHAEVSIYGWLDSWFLGSPGSTERAVRCGGETG